MDDDDSSETSDLGDMDDSVLGDNTEPITIENVALLAIECVEYVLNWHNLSWTPPIDPEDLRQRVQYEYFTPEIGKALVHHCMKSEILLLGAMTLFNLNAWLRLTVEEARTYVDEHFHSFLYMQPPPHVDAFVNLYLWAFACYLCFKAVKRNRGVLVSHVLDKLVDIMYTRSNISQPYYHINVKAALYNSLHEEIHSLSGDEGYRTNHDGVEDDIARFRD